MAFVPFVGIAMTEENDGLPSALVFDAACCMCIKREGCFGVVIDCTDVKCTVKTIDKDGLFVW